jgi:hypothetical protein
MKISRECEGAVLLEVVLALLLFVAAVAVVSSALNSSMTSVERQRLGLHAANLAASVHAELDLGLRSTETLGPEAFAAPYEEWTWQLQPAAAENQGSGASDASGLARIEVVIRNTNSPAVYRLTQTHRAVKTAVVATNAAPTKELAP